MIVSHAVEPKIPEGKVFAGRTQSRSLSDRPPTVEVENSAAENRTVPVSNRCILVNRKEVI